MNPLYELDVKKFKENYDLGEFCMLEYLKDYIPNDLEDLYTDAMNYNEIFCNDWTINKLFEMGKEDNYWISKANNFIKKYNVPKEDYGEHQKYFDKYIELRDKLLDELGLSRYISDDLSIDEISTTGLLEGEIITEIKSMNLVNSYTVARAISFGYCVELHYNEGESTIEYGYKITHDYWESEVEEIDWFNTNMKDDEILNKLFKLYDEHFGIEKEQEKDIEIEM